MKVMYVVGYDISTLGGGQKSVKTCLEVTANFGYHVSLVSPYIENGIELKNVKYNFYTRYNYRAINLILNTYSIYKYIRSEKPDIINCQYIGSIIFVGLLKKLRLINNKVIYTDRGFLEAYGTTVSILLKFIEKSIDKVICTTEENKKCWENRFPNLKFKVIENIIEDDWKEVVSLNSKNKDLCIGFSARFVPYKRWEDVIEIINCLEEYNIHFNLAIVWEKSQEKEIRKFKDRIKNSNVTFYDNLKIKDMKRFYSENDIFILTSEKESFGRTLIEAMSQKCVVIGTNSGGVPSVIHKNLYNIGDLRACIEIILKYYNDSDLLKKDKDYFYLEFKNRFTKEIFSNKLLEAYKEVRI